MAELQKKRLSATFEVQIRNGSEWQVVHALDDREGAILEAIALIDHNNDKTSIRVMGELHDALTNTTHPQLLWSHTPKPKPAPAVLYEERREARVAARKGVLTRRESSYGVILVVLVGFALFVYYVLSHVDLYYARH